MARLKASGRAKGAIAAVLLAAVTIGGALYSYIDDGRRFPSAVVLATDFIIKDWEGLVLTSHWDRYAKIYDICYGETRIDGKPVKPGMSFTEQQCKDMLYTRVYRDYYLPLTRCVANFTEAPISVQASSISGSYNFGTAGWCGSTAAKMVRAKRYREACEAQTAWNKAGGKVLQGLVNRREMGDRMRIGEGELCVSGLE